MIDEVIDRIDESKILVNRTPPTRAARRPSGNRKALAD
jgi:hypothetical protein